MTETSSRRATRGYADLEKLKEAHTDLLRRCGLFKDDPGFWDEVKEFLIRASATGEVLEAEAERYAAQGVITYWTNALYRSQGVFLDNNLLAEFDRTWCPDLDESIRPYIRAEEFVAGKASHLFGWERLVKESLACLETNGFAAVLGGAGSGRRSLVTEGVQPALRNGALPGSAGWRLLPPIMLTAEPLADLVRAVAPAANVSQEVAQLRQAPGALGRLLGDEPALLFLDRFERIFSADSRDQVPPLIDALVALAEAGRHRVIVTLRSDYLGHIAAFEALRGVFEHGKVFITFTARELRQAIEEPAKQVGLRFDPGLVDRILLDVQGDPAAASLLQFTLLQLWENRQGNRITRETYERLGGGRLALERAAERLYQGCADEGDKEVMRHIWTALVQPAVGGGWQGRIARRAELYRDGKGRDRVDRVLARLLEAGLVTSRAVDASQEETLAPVHEALIEVWPRLVEWLAEQRDLRRRWERLRAAAEQWCASREDRKMLWGGPALAEALLYPNLDERERKFLQASEANERWQALKRRVVFWCGIAGLFLFAMGVMVLLYSIKFKNLKAQTDEAEKRNALMRIGMSLRHVDAGAELANRGDVAGAVAWYGRALDLLDQNRNLLGEDSRHLRENYQFRLGLAWRRLPAIRRLLYHENMDGAIFSADGRWAAATVTENDAAGETLGGKVVLLWDLKSGTSHPPLPHTGPVNETCFSPDGKYLVTAGGSLQARGQVQVWRVDSRSKVGNAIPLPLSGKATQIEFSPDGRKVLIVLLRKEQTGGRAYKGSQMASEVVVWEITDGQLNGAARVLHLDGGGVVNRAAFRPPQGDRVVAAIRETADTGKVVIWDAATGKVVAWNAAGKAFGVHPDDSPIHYVCFPPYNKDQPEQPGRGLFITCGGREKDRQGEAVLWDGSADPPRQVRSLPHNGPVVHAAFNRSATQAVTSSQDGFARRWMINPSAPNASPVSVLAHDGAVNWADFSPDGRYVVTACRDRTARIWDAGAGRLAFPHLNHGGTVRWVQFSQDGRDILTLSANFSSRGVKEISTGHVWRLQDDGRPEWSVGTDGPIQHVNFDPTGKLFITVALHSGRTAAQVWDAEAGQPLSPPLPGNDRVKFAAVSADGRRVATLSGKTAYLWDAVKGKLLSAREHRGTVNYASFSPTGSWLLTAAGDEGTCSGEVQFWRAEDGRLLRQMRHDSAVLFGVFTRDGTRVLTTGGDRAAEKGEVRLYSVPSGEPITRFKSVHKEPVTHAAFSVDEKRVVTSSTDNMAWVWDLERAAHTGVILKKHTADVNQAAFSPDGLRVVTASADGTAIIWNSETGQDLAVLQHGGSVLTASFRPNGRHVATVSSNRVVSLWDVQPDEDASGETHVRDQRLIAALRHSGEVKHAAFVEGGARLRTLNYEDKFAAFIEGAPRPATLSYEQRDQQRVWIKLRDLEPDDSEVEQIRKQAPRVAKRSFNDKTGSLEINSVEVLWGNWDGEKAEYRNTLKEQADPAERHRYEADKAEAAGQWPAAKEHLGEVIKLKQAQPYLLVRRARISARLGQLQEAVADLDKAIEAAARRQPGAPSPVGLLARLHASRAETYSWLAGKLPEALRDYEEAVRYNPNDPLIWAAKAGVHQRNAEWEKALECWDHAVQLDGNTKTRNLQFRVNRSAVLGDKLNKRPRDVIDDCTEAINGLPPSPANASLYHRRAVARAKVDYPDNVSKAVDDYISAARGYSPGLWNLASGAYSKALSLAEEHQLASRVVEILEGRGRLHARRGATQWTYARRDFGRAVSLAPTYQLWRQLAQIDTNLKDWKEAAQDYKAAIGLAPAEEKVALLQDLAKVHFQAGEWDNAVEAYSDALLLRKNDPALLEQRANVHERAGRMDAALKDLGSAIKVQPSGPLYERRARLFESAGRWKDAIDDYTATIDLQPKAGWLYEKRAHARVELGQWSKAVSDLKKLSDLSTWSPSPLMRLAAVQVQQDDQPGVRLTCANLLKRFEETSSSLTANDAAWALVLSRETGDTARAAVKLARRAVDGAPGISGHLNTLGAAHYRAGDNENALKVLNESREQARKEQVARKITPVEDGIVEDWLFLAMTYQRLGRAAEARKWLDKARAWIDADEKKRKPEDLLALFWKRLVRRQFLAEAEKLVGASKQ